MLQRDDCEKAGVPDVLHAAGIHQRPFCCVTILASTDRCLLPSVFFYLSIISGFLILLFLANQRRYLRLKIFRGSSLCIISSESCLARSPSSRPIADAPRTLSFFLPVALDQ